MADFPALTLWTDAYLADTTDLSAEEHGVYLLLLMAAWRTPECALPDDDKRLARMARIGTKKWRSIRPTMERFWTVEDGKWTQKRLLRERERNEMLRSKKSLAGKASALKRQETGSTDVATEDPTTEELPLPNTLTYDSVPNGTAQSPPSDIEGLKAWAWRHGADWIAEFDKVKPATVKTFLGGHCRDFGAENVARELAGMWHEARGSPGAFVQIRSMLTTRLKKYGQSNETESVDLERLTAELRDRRAAAN